jgi:RNA polymerase sigma-70 factor (ECF subfamily)
MKRNIVNSSPDVYENIDLDQTIVQQVLAGDVNAFAHLVTRYQTSVYNLCKKMLQNENEAEDAAQEVFLRAYQQLHTYQTERKFSSWILSIASHFCIDLLRRRHPTMDLDEIMFWKTSQEPEPEEMAVSGEERGEVRELLKKLPEKYRMMIVLRYWYDLSYEEIAKTTALTLSNVKSRLFRAREILAKELQNTNPAEILPQKFIFGNR